MTRTQTIKTFEEYVQKHAKHSEKLKELMEWMYANHVDSQPKLNVTQDYINQYCVQKTKLVGLQNMKFNDVHIMEVFGEKFVKIQRKINVELLLEGFYYFLIDEALLPIALVAHQAGCKVQCCCSGHYSISHARLSGDEGYMWLELPDAGCKERLNRFLAEVNADKPVKCFINDICFEDTSTEDSVHGVSLRWGLKGRVIDSNKLSVPDLLKDRYEVMLNLYSAVKVIENVIKSEKAGYGKGLD